MKAIAYNNDVVAMVVVSTDNGQPIANCLGFSITRVDCATGLKTILSTPFAPSGTTPQDGETQPSNVWPIQSYIWRDYSVELDHEYYYEVVALTGSFDNLVPIVGQSAQTNKINVTTKVSDEIDVAFTRGILATQWMARHTPRKDDGSYDFDALVALLKTPGNPIRNQLKGNVLSLLEAPVSQAAATGGHVYQALFEFTDPELLNFLVTNASAISLILGSTGNDTTENQNATTTLQNAGATVIPRVLGKGSIPHNKCQASVDSNGHGVMVTSGAINWTTTGLCTQSSNVINIKSPALADQFVAEWKQLQNDTVNDNSSQGSALRSFNGNTQPTVTLNDGTQVQAWFSPNTSEHLKPKHDPATPPDMSQVFSAIDNAHDFVGSLLFIPGYPSVVSQIASDYPNSPNVIYRVAVSDKEALPWTVPTLRAGDPPLFLVANAITNPFYDYMSEFDLLPDAFAIIHSKYVVIDPLDSAIVVTGSHNLGFKASYQNDENLLIISGNKRLAMYYMVDNLDVYMHYLFNQEANDGTVSGNLTADDSWQSTILSGGSLKLINYLSKGNYPA